MKDFAAEIRGGKDIKEFILSALVLLDVQDTSIGDLLEIILRKIKQTNIPQNGNMLTVPTLSVANPTTTMLSGHRENLNIEEIKQALFVNDRGRLFFSREDFTSHHSMIVSSNSCENFASNNCYGNELDV